MHARSALTRLVICLVTLSLVTGCSTSRVVNYSASQPLSSQVAVGDKVEVLKKDGEKLRFKVSDVSAEGLHGPDVFVPAAEVDTVTVVEGVHPAMIAFVVALAATAVWMLVDSDDVCGDWPADPCE